MILLCLDALVKFIIFISVFNVQALFECIARSLSDRCFQLT